MQSPIASNTTPPTPTTPVAAFAPGKGGLPGGLEGTIAPADINMLNVLSAHRESVNTADGKTSKYEFYLIHLLGQNLDLKNQKNTKNKTKFYP